MSNSNSSREVTEKKKKEVWEEAGEEFYQESYPTGSGQGQGASLENLQPRTHHRSSIPLPSLTARKNSYSFQNNVRRGTFGRTATVTTNTNAFTTYSSTTRLGGGANHRDSNNISSLPDLADLTIPNEQKRWDELRRIKSMPISMNAKRELKAQLTTIPMLKLKGTKRLKWNLEKLKEVIRRSWRRRCRRNLLWDRSLRSVEDHSGTSITGIFMSLKWTIYYNLLLFLILNFCVIIPNMILDVLPSTREFGLCQYNTSSTNFSVEKVSWKVQMAECCSEEYEQSQLLIQKEDEENRWIALLNALNISINWFGLPSSLTYGYYQGTKLKIPKALGGGNYDLPMAYLLIIISVFSLTLLAVISRIRGAVKEVALSREGEFYKFSNLIFAGWDHYTKNGGAASFRKRILRNEMKVSLDMEKVKVFGETRRQKWTTITKRFTANCLTLFIIGGVGCANFHLANLSTHKSICFVSKCTRDWNNTTTDFQTTDDLDRFMYPFLPAIGVALSNFILFWIFRFISKLEDHSHETENILLLLRTLIGRLVAIGCVAFNFYNTLYCPKSKDGCTTCDNTEDKDPCWESHFGYLLLRILSADLIFQIVLILVFGYGRYLIGRVVQANGILDQTFSITKHSVDVLYIQSISWFFYFSPFLPFFIILYCFIIFYLKKCALLVLANTIPETVRTTRTKFVYFIARLIALTTVLIALGFVLFEMEPSKGCGPFRTTSYPWEILTNLDHHSSQDAINFITSPKVLIPLLLLISLLSYFYYSRAKANRRMVETLKHMLVLEGHDKQYLFARLNPVPEVAESVTLVDINATGPSKN